MNLKLSNVTIAVAIAGASIAVAHAGSVEDKGAAMHHADDQRFEGIERQRQERSCGAAALATTARYWLGLTEVTEQRILELYSGPASGRGETLARGLTIAELADLALKLGLLPTMGRVTLEELARVGKPAIVLTNKESDVPHFIVFIGEQNGDVYAADPKLGHVRIPKEDFRRMWLDPHGDGVAMIVDHPNGRRLVASRLGMPSPRDLARQRPPDLQTALFFEQAILTPGRRFLNLSYTATKRYRTISAQGDFPSVNLQQRDLATALTLSYEADEVTRWTVGIGGSVQRLAMQLVPVADAGAVESHHDRYFSVAVQKTMPLASLGMVTKASLEVGIPLKGGGSPSMGWRGSIERPLGTTTMFVDVGLDRAGETARGVAGGRSIGAGLSWRAGATAEMQVVIRRESAEGESTTTAMLCAGKGTDFLVSGCASVLRGGYGFTISLGRWF